MAHLNISSFAFIAILSIINFISCHADPNPNGIDAYIINGDKAHDGAFPYQVSIQIDNKHECGGSIYSDRIIITAGHCVLIPGNYSVRAGSTKREEGGVVVNVQQKLSHENFDVMFFKYDIALILLETPLNLEDQNIKTVPLASNATRLINGMEATVTGWGVTEDADDYSEELRNATVQFIDINVCKYFYEDLTDDQICAGYIEGKVDACTGDSGGPLVVRGEQIGIVSYGNGCAEPKSPGVYTKMSYFRDWIDSTVQSLLESN